jgi:serine/threonine protein kinase
MNQLNNNATLCNGKYKIERVLGQGGFGITYLAKQKVSVAGALGTIDAEIEVTVKEFFMKELCNRDEASSAVTVPSTGSAELVEKFRQKFIKEAKNISKLKHPHIIKVLDVFEENSTAYYVMEYIDGGSLSDLIEEKGTLKEEETLKYTRQIASALQYIHSLNMNHLDVKPGNVLLRQNGDVVLIDFGMSKNYDVAGEQTTSSPIGVSVGYAPIEQSRAGGLGTFSPATDIYSLGATMFKMLMGQTPPEATTVFDEGLPELPAEVSDTTKKVIEKAMQPRRKERYQTIEEFLIALNGEQSQQLLSVEETIVETPAEDTQYIAPAKTEVEVQPKEQPKVETKAKEANTPKLKFLKEDDKEATKFITDFMVQESNIDTSDVVDLGLSVKWCGHNLGATVPEEYGSYYCWADRMNGRSLDGFPAEPEIAGTKYDAASNASEGKFKTPTRRQFKELIDRCRWSWVTYHGTSGCKITGPSGKSIFLPGAGRKSDFGIYRKDAFGYYWSSSKAHNLNACYLYFNEEDSDLTYEPILTLRSIRPVCE